MNKLIIITCLTLAGCGSNIQIYEIERMQEHCGDIGIASIFTNPNDYDKAVICKDGARTRLDDIK